MDTIQNQASSPGSGPDKQELYKRGREAAMDLVKLGITLATGVIGALFVVLTSKEKKTTILKPENLCFLESILALMVVCIGSGLLGLAAHAAFYSSWADGKVRSNNRWRRIRKWSFFITVISFAAGMVLAAIWVFLISRKP